MCYDVFNLLSENMWLLQSVPKVTEQREYLITELLVQLKGIASVARGVGEVREINPNNAAGCRGISP